MKKNKLSKLRHKPRVFHKAESIFRKWLFQNINRFNNKPISNTKGGFYFEGITKAINLEIDFTQPEAMLSFNNISTNELYDYFTIEYIGDEKYYPLKGFYDADRVDKIYTYYNTYSELIISEVFEPIIKYCNENFKQNRALYLINYDGSTEGFISSLDETNISKINKLKLNSNKGIQYLKYKLFT